VVVHGCAIGFFVPTKANSDKAFIFIDLDAVLHVRPGGFDGAAVLPGVEFPFSKIRRAIWQNAPRPSAWGFCYLM
jgi:hypothetical protein